MTDRTAPLGATGGEDLSGLRKTHLAERRIRDLVETEAIARTYDAHVFRGRAKKPGSQWLTSLFIRKVHRDMFRSVWDWAGKFRTSNKNIGIEWHQVPQQVESLCQDFHFWDTHSNAMSMIEIAARLQNRLTRIHPFDNGNGRHARLLTDIYFRSQGKPLPQWPQIHRLKEGEAIRNGYLAAMRSADQDNYKPLMEFFERFIPR